MMNPIVPDLTSALEQLCVLWAISVSNLYFLPRLSRFVELASTEEPLVSILVPCRNEERNVGPCLKSLLALTYPHYELIALDDHSDDGTAAALAALAADDSCLTVVKGQPLPEGWLGKHWACQQLADMASGTLLLFADADTVHSPQSLALAVNALSRQKAGLLTAMPKEIVRTWSELLLVPFMVWSVQTILPVALAHHTRWSAFSSACGQYMLFTRECYDAIGGHAAVRDDVVDDLALSRAVKRAGHRLRLANACGELSCRMYNSVAEVVPGFTKNFFALFEYRLLPALFVWAWLVSLLVAPLVTTLAHPTPLGVLVVMMSSGLWALNSWRHRLPFWGALLYPVTAVVASLIGLASIGMTVLGTASWKGRTLRHRLRVI